MIQWYLCVCVCVCVCVCARVRAQNCRKNIHFRYISSFVFKLLLSRFCSFLIFMYCSLHRSVSHEFCRIREKRSQERKRVQKLNELGRCQVEKSSTDSLIIGSLRAFIYFIFSTTQRHSTLFAVFISVHYIFIQLEVIWYLYKLYIFF